MSTDVLSAEALLEVWKNVIRDGEVFQSHLNDFLSNFATADRPVTGWVSWRLGGLWNWNHSSQFPSGVRFDSKTTVHGALWFLRDPITKRILSDVVQLKSYFGVQSTVALSDIWTRASTSFAEKIKGLHWFSESRSPGFIEIEGVHGIPELESWNAHFFLLA